MEEAGRLQTLNCPIHPAPSHQSLTIKAVTPNPLLNIGVPG